jgi:aminoglycoside phosphotransferase (APT) family kinase protein
MSSLTLDPIHRFRPGFEFDVARLESWLGEHLPGFRGPLRVSQFSGGQSNPTYLLEAPDRRYVLRRKPPGVLLPSAHAIDREFRLMRALGAGSDVPVATALALCEDPAVLGTAFYVMAHVDGRIFWNPALPELDAARRAPVFRAMVDALARLHAVQPADVGLADFGRPEGYIPRQVARWSKQYQGDLEAAGRVEAMAAAERAGRRAGRGDRPRRLPHRQRDVPPRGTAGARDPRLGTLDARRPVCRLCLSPDDVPDEHRVDSRPGGV